MSDLVHPDLRGSRPEELRGLRERIPLLSLLRKAVTSNGPTWLPLVLVLAAIAGVAYADHLVVSLSLVYLYTLPLTVGAIFLLSEYTHYGIDQLWPLFLIVPGIIMLVQSLASREGHIGS